MADLQDTDPLVEAVAKTRAEASRRPELKRPIGTLNQIGRHVYAYSGTFSSLNSSQTMLDFTTGSEIIVGRVHCNGAVNVSDVNAGLVDAFTVTMNGQTIALLKTETGSERQWAAWVDVIIPPFTHVTVTTIAANSNAGYLVTALITGEAFSA